MNSEFDYIIVGAGSAGCVIANRLSEDTTTRVLLLEAGPVDSNLYIQVPAGFPDVLNNTALHWRYESEPEPELGGRRMWQQRGKVLGGSSSINAMAYVRGHPLDYDNWVAMGAHGWGYADVLPYFRKSESYAGGADTYRGQGGPLGVQQGSNHSPLFEAFIRAGVEAGYGRTEDINGYRQEGFGFCDSTLANSRRASTASAFLHPFRDRVNLEVRTESLVTRVVLEDGRATGVETLCRGERQTLSANREVILCGGAINSPQLLMLSGIGPGETLRNLGIEVIRDLPGVGDNLMDHLCFYMHWACTQPVSIQPYMQGIRRWIAGLQWLTFKSGMASKTHGEAVAFMRSRAGVEHPDIQVDFLPAAYLPSYLAEMYGIKPPAHGFSSHIGQLRPESRGHVELRSSDPHDKPRITFNYLSCDEDWRVVRAALRLVREVHRQPAFDRYRGVELLPGEFITEDDQIDAFIRETASTNFHVSGTCRMGTDEASVVDPKCRVHGVDGLRVAAASVMPQLISGNPNAPTIMIGEKVVDHIRGELEPPAKVNFHGASDWRQSQRDSRPTRGLA